MSSQSTTLDRLAAQIVPVEWTIYPSGTGTFACGSPDGSVLRDGQALDILLGGHWIAGFIESHPHTAAQFVAQDDQHPCGLCPGMRIRLLMYQIPPHNALLRMINDPVASVPECASGS